MPYSPIVCVNGSTPLNATWGNLVQTQYTEASNSVNQDEAGAPYVFSGLACVKDPTTASKLNMGAGVAWVTQTDNTLRRRALSFTSFTTATPSTTYFLDLNPDGTTSWATAHSGTANYLPICSVTTDGSGNISGVTDARVFIYKALTSAVNPSVKTPVYQLPAPISAILTQSASNVGAVVGGVTFGQTGALAASMDSGALFNGTTGYVTAQGSSGLPTGNAAFSVEAWFKTGTGAGTLGILQFGNPTATKQGAALYLAAGKLTGDLGGSSVASAVTYSNSAWHHGVFTWDGTNGTLFVDGAQVATSATLGPNNCTLGMAVGIGALIGATGAGNSFFPGTLDEVAIYGTTLSLARVQAHYNAGVATASDAYATTVLSDSPLRYYRLGDASGSTVAVCTTTPTVTTLVDAGGTLKSIGGQASVGAFGAPVMVAQVVDYNMTSTALLNILIYAVTATGHYRISATATAQNATTPQGISILCHWTDPHTNAQNNEPFVTLNSGVVTALSGSNNVSTTSANSYPLMPLLVHAKAGTNLTVSYNDPGGTPNDFISAYIERID